MEVAAMRFTGGRTSWIVVTAAAAGLALPFGASAPALGAPASSWPQARYSAAQTGYNPNETQLSTANVGRLVTRTTTPLGDTYGGSTPVVADGMVFVTSYSINSVREEVQAFPETCGTTCSPLWTGMVGYAAGSAVAVAGGEVFVDSDTLAPVPSQELWVFPEHCSAACSPLWRATIPGSVGSEAPPTVAGGTVYIPGGQQGSAYLYAYPPSCSTPCKPTWRGIMDIGDTYEPATVGDGFVYVPDYDGNLYAYHVGCATGGRKCSPAWQGYTGQLGPGGAAYANGLVFLGSQNDDVYAFKATGCGISVLDCSPAWQAVTGSNVRSEPAVANGLVYITSDDGYLYAFSEHCASTCKPTWKAFLSSGEDSFHSSPAVANGVVYVSWTNSVNTQGIDAFSATCATGGGTCSRLWEGNGGSYYLLSGPAVAGGELWAAGGPQNGPADLYAFGLPVPSRASTGS
jgi:hypothetical protein